MVAVPLDDAGGGFKCYGRGCVDWYGSHDGSPRRLEILGLSGAGEANVTLMHYGRQSSFRSYE